MTVASGRQAMILLVSLGEGLLLALVYDILRALRRLRTGLSLPLDLGFCLLWLLTLSVTAVYTEGLRIYQLLGIFVGAGGYFLLLSPRLLPRFLRLFRHLGRVCLLLLTPVKKSVENFRNLRKKLFSSAKKWGTINEIPSSLKHRIFQEKQP